MTRFPPIDLAAACPEPPLCDAADVTITAMSRSALEHIAIHDGSHDYGYCWGYTIFRTVYTPGSNEAVTEALERLAVYAKHFFTWGQQQELHQLRLRGRRGEGQLNTRPNEELISRYYNELVQDEESLADASESEVGERFDAWITQNRRPVTARFTETNTRFLFCVMLDEESLDNILALPQDPDAPMNFSEKGKCYVKVISNRMKTEEEDGGEGRYWLRVGIRDYLFFVWFLPAEDQPDIIIEELGWSDPEDGVQNLWGTHEEWSSEIMRAIA